MEHWKKVSEALLGFPTVNRYNTPILNINLGPALAFFAEAFGAWRFLKMISAYLSSHCQGGVELNAGRSLLELEVTNTGDRPIQVGRCCNFWITSFHFLNTLRLVSVDFIRLHSTKPNDVLVPGRCGFFRWVLITTSLRRINRWCLIGRRQSISNQVCQCVVVFPRKHDKGTAVSTRPMDVVWICLVVLRCALSLAIPKPQTQPFFAKTSKSHF